MKKIIDKITHTNLFLISVLVIILALINTFIKEIVLESILAITLSILLVICIKRLKPESKIRVDILNKNIMRMFKTVCFIIVGIAIVFNIVTQKELLNKYNNYSINIEMNEALNSIIRYSDSCTKLIAINSIEVYDTIHYYTSLITKNSEVTTELSNKYTDLKEDGIGKNLISTFINCKNNINIIKLSIQFNFITLISIIISLLSFNKNIKRK